MCSLYISQTVAFYQLPWASRAAAGNNQAADEVDEGYEMRCSKASMPHLSYY